MKTMTYQNTDHQETKDDYQDIFLPFCFCFTLFSFLTWFQVIGNAYLGFTCTLATVGEKILFYEIKKIMLHLETIGGWKNIVNLPVYCIKLEEKMTSLEHAVTNYLQKIYMAEGSDKHSINWA